MDNIDAPQWTDFTAPSPQVIDDYFLRKHEQQDYQLKFETPEAVTPIKSFKKLNKSKQPLSESFSDNESDNFQTPLKAPLSLKKKCSSSLKKNQNLKETTYENVLITAMKNLEFSFKKSDKSGNKSCLLDSPILNNPTAKRVTRSMCVQAANISKHEHEHEQSCIQLHLEESADSNEIEENKENVNSKELIAENDKKSSSVSVSLQVSESVDQDELGNKSKITIEQKPEEKDSSMKTAQPVKSKILATSFSQGSFNSSNNSLKKKPATLTGNAWHRQMKRRLSLNRRLSLVKPPVTNKYVSMAEAVNKFQRVTPARFHTVNVKTTKTEQLRRQSFKLTRAHSPALMSKNRSRPVTAVSREEQERLELEKIRQNQIKANPVRKDILKRPAPLKKVEKKMVTNPEPFHLTETKKGQVSHDKPKETKRTHHIIKKTVPSIVSTDDKHLMIKDEEILHFGIPLEPGNTKKKVTRVEPFSFELRNQELQKRKQEKLKALQEVEKQKIKAEFHARPVPAAVKTPHDKLLIKQDSAKKPKIPAARSLSFDERNKELKIKKEAKIKQMLEEERKARSFKAQKVPEFKPVLVKGRSTGNLFKKYQENLSTKTNDKRSSQENLATKSKSLIKKPLTLPFSVVKKESKPSAVPLSENKKDQKSVSVPKILEPKRRLLNKSNPAPFELHSDKRAKQRKEFDEYVKKKELEEEEMKKREEEERIAKESAEKLELRKQAEVKARPMPTYKYMQISKSKKPLTDAESPKWAKSKRQAASLN